MSNNSKTGCRKLGGEVMTLCIRNADDIMQNYNDDIKNNFIDSLILESEVEVTEGIINQLREELSNRIFKPITPQQGGKKSKKRKTKKYNRIKKKGKKKSKSKTKKRR